MNARANRVAALCLTAALGGCSMMPSWLGSSADKPKPAELGPNAALINVRTAWTARIGPIGFPLTASVNGSTLALASGDGSVAQLDAASGRQLWQASAGAPLAAGVGSDGKLTSVITRTNDIVTFAGGATPLWRQKLAAQSYTAPLVAGGRVFVLAADRSVSAYDGQSGRRLWNQQRPGEPLVLRQSGVLLAVGDTLVVGTASSMKRRAAAS